MVCEASKYFDSQVVILPTSLPQFYITLSGSKVIPYVPFGMDSRPKRDRKSTTLISKQLERLKSEQDIRYGFIELPFCAPHSRVVHQLHPYENNQLALYVSSPHFSCILTVVIVNFPLDDDPSVRVIAWTTTPWTLPSNLALCVHPEFTYVKVKGQFVG